jgi:hypothetical protein
LLPLSTGTVGTAIRLSAIQARPSSMRKNAIVLFMKYIVVNMCVAMMMILIIGMALDGDGDEIV